MCSIFFLALKMMGYKNSKSDWMYFAKIKYSYRDSGEYSLFEPLWTQIFNIHLVQIIQNNVKMPVNYLFFVNMALYRSLPFLINRFTLTSSEAWNFLPKIDILVLFFLF